MNYPFGLMTLLGLLTLQQLVPYLGAHAKDKVENWFHSRVCRTWRGTASSKEQMSLAQAQMGLAEHWTAHYAEWLTRKRR